MVAAGKGKLIAWGAEAELYETLFLGRKAVAKRRAAKAYRIREIDVPIRKTRAKAEANLLHKAKLAGVRTPLLLWAGEFDIIMERVSGRLLREEIRAGKRMDRQLAKTGAFLARLHACDMVHGDFTPANVMIDGKGEPVVIDFGLGAFSQDLEDKAMDLLLMKKGLGDRRLYAAFRQGYARECKNAEKVFAQLSEIEKRGRYVVRAMTG